MKKGRGRPRGMEKGRPRGMEKGRPRGMEKGRPRGMEKGRPRGMEKPEFLNFSFFFSVVEISVTLKFESL